MAILDFLKRQTKVYDPSQNTISIAGLELDAVTRISITTQPINKVVEGTHSSYTTIVRRHLSPTMVSISIMPSSASLPKIMQLYQYVKEYGCFFELSVKRSGVLVFQSNATFEKKNDYDIQNESSDYAFSFIANTYGSATENVAIAGDFDIADFAEGADEALQLGDF